MENVVHNPAELGEIAGKTRAELGLRQSDLHAYTKLNPRFIGEVEHGKATAQIGKVMQMLESIGLEMVIRPQTREFMANPHTLGLSRGRFWSSGNQLPATRIIARVLADPAEPDLVKLKQHFGMGLILATWKRLTERGDIAESVVPITRTMLRKLATIS
ncbi:MAG: hypothetical protein L3K25_19595 [Gammaproteobacteria bacterium]|nr:hypothetical protein [Gammaproteobacteria bacterium]